MRLRYVWTLLAILMCAASPAWAAPVTITLGSSVVALNGPWKFHTGDDAHWAVPDFDDSKWEAVGLTPRTGAHDGDVGLKNYVPGWSARGHRGYTGYAWYRLAVRVAATGDPPLWLAGPADVDNCYQIYFNGRLIGGIGDFSRNPPVVVAIQPRMFALPDALWSRQGGQRSGVIAIRVAMIKGSLGTGAPDSGGIHIAPLIGAEKGVGDHYRLEWLQTVEGYTVDAVEALVFLLLAVMALTLFPFDRKDDFYPWLAAALMLLAAARGNQVIYFWGQFETAREFVLWRLTLADALTLGAWTMAWKACFKLDARWMTIACVSLTILYIFSRALSTVMLAPGMPHAAAVVFADVLQIVRAGFIALFVCIAIRGAIRPGRDRWIALSALVLVAIGLFAQEISFAGIPGIWFPYGIGVSRTEYAYAVFDVALFVYLVRKLWGFAPTAR